MTYRSAHLTILLVFGLLTSGVGCQVLPIPSYRADRSWPEAYSTADVGAPSDCAYGDNSHNIDCPPGFLPPMQPWPAAGVPVPRWWAKWRAQRQLPEPAPYPRFHPLPTRPMFQSLAEPQQLGTHHTYGWQGQPLAPAESNYGHLAE